VVNALVFKKANNQDAYPLLCQELIWAQENSITSDNWRKGQIIEFSAFSFCPAPARIRSGGRTERHVRAGRIKVRKNELVA